MSTHQRVGPWRSAIGWIYTKRGTIVLSVVPLLIGILAIAEYVHAGGPIFLATGFVILALVIREWVRLYRHRNDADWPPKPKWVARQL